MRSLTLMALVIFLATGCSSFHRDWKEANRVGYSSGSIEGSWDGSWQSEENGHHGRLRALISKTGENKFEARYRATYAKIFTFEYAVDLIVTETNGGFAFTGSADLGKLSGGVYEYEGHASPTNFFSAYESQYDHGTFELERPEVEQSETLSN